MEFWLILLFFSFFSSQSINSIDNNMSQFKESVFRFFFYYYFFLKWLKSFGTFTSCHSIFICQLNEFTFASDNKWMHRLWFELLVFYWRSKTHHSEGLWWYTGLKCVFIIFFLSDYCTLFFINSSLLSWFNCLLELHDCLRGRCQSRFPKKQI